MPRPDSKFYLARLRRTARERGGRLLSSSYLGDRTKLRFRCAEGHEWTQIPGGVQQGKWCPKCGHHRAGAARRGSGSDRLYRKVAEQGGAVVSPRYVNSQTKLRYRCRAGHEWATVPNSILRGSWCPKCARIGAKHQQLRKLRVSRRIERVVQRLGGRVVSEYVDSVHPVRVRCASGHEWDALPQGLDRGTWCRECRAGSVLIELRAIAERWDGACLTRQFRHFREPMRWRCVQGHVWSAPAAIIKRGCWCPRCRLPGRGDLQRMQQLARERGGACLSKSYGNCETRMLWRCAAGHTWRAPASAIVQGTWCRLCERGFGRSRVRLSIEVMQDMAAAQGGECLSRDYDGIYSRLRWRCARGHEWVTPANNVRRGGWCPRCAHTVRGTLDGMRALAAGHGGKCLTRIWNNHKEPLQFVCRRGHRFHARANPLKTGVWCGICNPRAGRSSR